MKRDFISWVDMEFAETVLDTPENRVYYVWKKIEKIEKIEGVEKIEKTKEGRYEDSFIHRLESLLIPVLARMESRGVAFDKNKLIDI